MPNKMLLAIGILLVPIFFHIPAAAQTPHAVKLGAAQYFTFPNSGAWTEGSGRIEFRLQNVSQPSSDLYIHQLPWAECRINANSMTLRCLDGPDSAIVNLDLTGRTDIRVRLTRDLTARVFTVEVWDGDGSNRISGNFETHAGTFTATGTSYLLSNLGTPSGGGELAFMRRYSTMLPLNSAAPAEAPDAAGDRGDFRFENSLADSGPAGLTLTLLGGGSVVYVSSPTYAPTAAIARAATARGSFSIGLDGSRSFSSLLGNGIPAFFWQQLSGPVIGPMSNRRVAAPTFTPPLAGSYVIQLTVTDLSGRTGVVSETVGAVATDADGLVITDNPTLDKLLGPLTRSGTSPWPYFDLADRALGETIATAALANPPHLGAQLTGTVQITNNPTTLIGTGTLFTTELSVGMPIIVAWNTIDGPGTGRHWDTISAITDDTHATLAGYENQIDLASGLSFYAQPENTATFQPFWWGQAGGAQSRSWNYYDVALALYRLHYRTGVTAYLTYARQFADNWWQWSIDHGRQGQPPRVAAMQSQFIRALDGHPERFVELKTLADYYATRTQMPHDLLGRGFDAREAGYATWFVALGAMADPDPTRHASYCSTLASIVPLWNTWQQPAGYWSEDLYSYNDGYPYVPPGASPWRTDIPIHGLQAAYDVMVDTSSVGCNNTSLAATTLATITKAVDWTYNTGRADQRSGGNGGVYYESNYESLGQVPLTVSGTVSVNLSSTSVTGSGTSFLTQLNCDGTRYLGFLTTHTLYKVTACADDTHLTISPAFGFWGEVSNISGGAANAANRSYPCKNSSGAMCGDGPDGDRNLTRLMPGITGWLYRTTGTQKYKAWGDNWFSNAFGGPGNGPGGSDSCIGTGCDGAATDFEVALPYCGISPNPPTICTNLGGSTSPGNAYIYLGKNYGQGSGAPAAQTYLAYRLGGTSSPQNRTVYVDLPPTVFLVPMRVQLQITAPSGATASTLCFASPCPVTVDARQGNHLMKMVYLSISGRVLATSDLTVLTVGLD